MADGLKSMVRFADLAGNRIRKLNFGRRDDPVLATDPTAF